LQPLVEQSGGKDSWKEGQLAEQMALLEVRTVAFAGQEVERRLVVHFPKIGRAS